MTTVVVVTGTDTEVGKTFVTVALCHALREAGLVVRAVKPVESGVAAHEPADHEDGVLLAKACEQDWPLAALQRLAAPLAPPVAAALEGTTVHDETWSDVVARLASEADVVFVEAAGGLLSPISERHDARSLACQLNASLLVVGRDSLGTINHTRLVLEAIGSLDVIGVILSAPAEPDDSTGRNIEELRRVTGVERFGCVARHNAPRDARRDLSAVVSWFQSPPTWGSLMARSADLPGPFSEESQGINAIEARFELVEEALRTTLSSERFTYLVFRLAIAIRDEPSHLHRYLSLRDSVRERVMGPGGGLVELRQLEAFDTAPSINDVLDLRRTLAHLIATRHQVVESLRAAAFSLFVSAEMWAALAVHGPTPADVLEARRTALRSLLEKTNESRPASPAEVCARDLSMSWRAFCRADLQEDFEEALSHFVRGFDHPAVLTETVDLLAQDDDWFVREELRDLLWELLLSPSS